MALPRVAGLLLALVLSASARAEVTPAQAETVMRQCGLWTQMDAAAPQFRMTVEQAAHDRALGFTPEMLRQLAPRLERNITPAALRPRMQAELARALRAEDLPNYVAWFGSATGRRVVELQQKMEAEALNTGLDPQLPLRAWHDAGVARQNLLDELVERARVAELQVTMFNEITPALHHLVVALDPGSFHETEADLRRRMARNTVGLPRQMHLNVRMDHALQFQALSDAELQAWFDFLKSPAGERLTEATIQASVKVPLALLAELAKPEP